MKKIYLCTLAAAVTTIWALAFIVTKILIEAGLAPAQIMLYRFVIAYICMLVITPKPLFAKNIKDEFMLMLTGATGGTIYFLSENTALGLTQASNVGIIIALAPLLTVLASHLFLKGERLTKRMIIGSIFAFVGVILVVENGQMVLDLNPIGDALALAAATTWAIYSVILKTVERRGYGTRFITRKLFFYAIVTLLPTFIFTPISPSAEVFLLPKVIYSILFLAVICSFSCFFLWSYIVKELGTISSSRFIYLMPLVALIASAFILDETITFFAVAGMILITAGVVYSRS